MEVWALVDLAINNRGAEAKKEKRFRNGRVEYLTLVQWLRFRSWLPPCWAVGATRAGRVLTVRAQSVRYLISRSRQMIFIVLHRYYVPKYSLVTD